MVLLQIIEPKLLQSHTMSILSWCGQLPLCPGHILGLTIRWLSGGSYHDIQDAGNFSKPTFFHLLWLGLNALNSCNELKMKLPQTENELEEVWDGFTKKSTDGVMSACVGASDGFLFLIRTPRRREATNSRLYFSGHYSRMGLIVQAMCDANCKITYMAVLAPGRSSNLKAYKKSSLQRWVENLLPMHFVSTDNAYICTEHLLTPFCGRSWFNDDFDTYNFYLSQLQIQIEMVFGLLVTKWRILYHHCKYHLKMCIKVLLHAAFSTTGASINGDFSTKALQKK